MRVISWNLAKRKKVLNDQVKLIDSLSPNILFLQETFLSNNNCPIEERLRDRGYKVRSTAQLAFDNGHKRSGANILATSQEIDFKTCDTGQSLSLKTVPDAGGLNFPEKIQKSVIVLEDLEIEMWNLHAVTASKYGLEKTRMLEAVYEGIKNGDGKNGRIPDNSRKRPVILAGDFNTPYREKIDGQIVTFAYIQQRNNYKRVRQAELNILRGLGEFGMVDAYRYLKGYEEMGIYSHKTGGSEFRLDHIFASEGLQPTDCSYEESGFEFSDHALVWADFAV